MRIRSEGRWFLPFLESSLLRIRPWSGFQSAGGGTFILRQCWKQEDYPPPCGPHFWFAGRRFRFFWSTFCVAAFISNRCARNWRISCVARSEVGAASWEYFQMDSMHYLFAAFLAIWIILALYLFSLHSREKKLREEIERLKRTLENR